MALLCFAVIVAAPFIGSIEQILEIRARGLSGLLHAAFVLAIFVPKQNLAKVLVWLVCAKLLLDIARFFELVPPIYSHLKVSYASHFIGVFVGLACGFGYRLFTSQQKYFL